MAAWIVVGVVAGLVVGAGAMWLRVGEQARRLAVDYEHVRRDAESWRRIAEARLPDPVGDPPWVRELMTRLLDAALPAREEVGGGDGEGRPPTPPEYEPPPPQVNDWTDPFFGITRETVGGLRPGEGIPGIGGDEIVSDGMVATDAGWVPGDDDIARWQDVGEEVGEQWLQSRE